MFILVTIVLTFLYWTLFYQINKQRFDVLAYIVSMIIFGVADYFWGAYIPVLFLVFFFGYCRIKEGKGYLRLSYFYSIYIVYIGFMLSNLISLIFYELFSGAFIDKYMTVLQIISTVAPVFIHYLVARALKINFTLLRRSDPFIKEKILKPLNYLLTFFVLVFFSSYYYELTLDTSAPITEYTKYIMFVYAFMFGTVLFFISNRTRAYLQLEIQRAERLQIKQLNQYTTEIEHMYQTLRSFRHDYQNMLISLQDSIDSEDLDLVKQTYQEVLVKAKVKINHHAANVNELANVQDHALKSVLYWKLTEARDSGVKTDIEIREDIPSQLALSTLDLVRVLSILLDNAIEAAKKTANPELRYVILCDQANVVIIVQNNSTEEHISLNKIFKSGYSTKDGHHGLGLTNVVEITDRNPAVNWETSFNNHQFTQKLVIGER
ncbi:sensor histidine kinase [Lapidilactobacillus bayanensis]|uniref:sensor histidine kinase n=1 Tax=Lapidilactobacillus bayanensis TaxID=2485998 RepID=UPI0013DE1C65|nr:sensor histidine kinase [Lapidilactobacillus bayanensis]